MDFVSQFLHAAWQALVYFICPPSCFSCKKEFPKDAVLCADCALQIEPIMSYNYSVTEKYIMPVYALGLYQGVLQQMIVAKHYRTDMYAKALARLMIERSLLPHPQSYDYIIPIPLHWTRYARRGYNQSATIAQELALAYGVPALDALVRVKKTKLQVNLSAQERFENLKHAFGLKEECKSILAGKRIVLVDDLFTSGATIKSAVSVLREYKIDSCVVVVAARVLY